MIKKVAAPWCIMSGIRYIQISDEINKISCMEQNIIIFGLNIKQIRSILAPIEK